MTHLMQDSYETYYGSAVYDARYPAPNARTSIYLGAALVGAHGADVLDIGAGNGRYAIPLAATGQHHIWAVERSVEARQQLAERARTLRPDAQLDIVGGLDELTFSDLNIRAGLLLFGVLAHMSRHERSDVMLRLREHMAPGAVIVGSVPNAHRRFRQEQRLAVIEPEGTLRITYVRSFGAERSEFEYSLFSAESLGREMRALGWSLTHVCAESILPESVVTRRRTVGHADRRLSRIAPANWGYGLLFTASPI